MRSVTVHGNWSFRQPPSDTNCGICFDTVRSTGVNHPLSTQKRCISFFHSECIHTQLFQTVPEGQVQPSKYRILRRTDPAGKEMDFVKCPVCQNQSFITDTFLKSLKTRLLLEKSKVVGYCLSLLHYSVLLITAGAPIFGLASVIHRLSCSLLTKSALAIVSAAFFGAIGMHTAKAVSNLSLQYLLKN